MNDVNRAVAETFDHLERSAHTGGNISWSRALPGRDSGTFVRFLPDAVHDVVESAHGVRSSLEGVPQLNSAEIVREGADGNGPRLSTERLGRPGHR